MVGEKALVSSVAYGLIKKQGQTMQDGNVLAREEMIFRGSGQTAAVIRFENRLFLSTD